MKFSSQGKQLSIDGFRFSLDSLSKSNRWVQLGDTLSLGLISSVCITLD